MTNSTDDAASLVELLDVMEWDSGSRGLVIGGYDQRGTGTSRTVPFLNQTAGAIGSREPARAMQPYLTNDLADSDVACVCLSSVLPACVVQSLSLRLLRLMHLLTQSILFLHHVLSWCHDGSSLRIYYLALTIEESESVLPALSPK